VRDVDALRALPMQALLDAQVRLETQLAASPQLGGTDVTGADFMPFQPSVGRNALAHPPYAAVRDGASADVALLVGTNAHEATLWYQTDPGLEKLERITGRYLKDPARALEAYRRDHPGATTFDLLIALTTDYMFRIPVLRLAEAHTANGGRTFNYLFSWRSRAFGGRLGATHALEIPFTFNNLDRMGVDTFLGEGPVPQDLADAMHASWIAFIRTGDPNPSERTIPEWPRFDAERRPLMEFGDEIALREDPFPETRPLWDGR